MQTFNMLVFNQQRSVSWLRVFSAEVRNPTDSADPEANQLQILKINGFRVKEALSTEP